MFDNHLYNLMNQLVQEHKSLWRIKNEYGEDAGGCADCEALWKQVRVDKEKHIKELKNLVRDHLNAEG